VTEEISVPSLVRGGATSILEKAG
jgi:hypothetical protein